MGRKTIFDQSIAADICAQLAEGKSLKSICRQDGMPSSSAVLAWVDADYDGFADQYAQARARGYMVLADGLLEASEPPEDDEDSAIRVARDRLRTDTRKWMLSKMLPKLYGDKLDVDVKGTMAVTLQSSDDNL